jgi:predicted dehydrogenase
MNPIRIGIVGLGIGRNHIKGYRTHPNAEVVAIVDVDKNRLDEVGKEYGIAGRYTSIEDMLANEKPDVVSVCTPNKFHKSLTIAALKAGAHVMCEKPMAMNAKEAKEMLAMAKKMKRRLMINFSYRFNDQSWALKQEAESGIFGDIYFGRTIWHRRRGMPKFGGWFGQKKLSGGGPLIDLGVHRLDLALWLMNYPKPTWVMGNAYSPIASALAKKEKKVFDVEDLAAGMVKFSNGAMLEVEASWAANIGENELMETRLLGTSAGLVQRNVGGGYEFEAVIYTDRDGRQYDMKVHPPLPEGPKTSMFHFIDCIASNKPHTATGEEGVIVMEILDALYKSAQIGKPVQIK